MPTLYEISEKLSEIAEVFIENNGEIPAGEEGDRLLAYLEDVEQDRDRKILNVCSLIANMEADSQACEVEIKRLKQTQTAADNLAARLKRMLIRFFQLHEIGKLDLGFFRPRIQSNAGLRPLIYPEAWNQDSALMPERYQHTRIILNTELLRQDLVDIERKRLECVEACETQEELNDQLSALPRIEGCEIANRGVHFRLR